jgi:hypothetical protein
MFQFLPLAMHFSSRRFNSWIISYATGRLNLGVINQVNEGLLMIALMAIVGGIIGNETWSRESIIPRLTLAQAFVYPMFLLIAIVSTIQLAN